jgi:hypothetical protein
VRQGRGWRGAGCMPSKQPPCRDARRQMPTGQQTDDSTLHWSHHKREPSRSPVAGPGAAALPTNEPGGVGHRCVRANGPPLVAVAGRRRDRCARSVKTLELARNGCKHSGAWGRGVRRACGGRAVRVGSASGGVGAIWVAAPTWLNAKRRRQSCRVRALLAAQLGVRAGASRAAGASSQHCRCSGWGSRGGAAEPAVGASDRSPACVEPRRTHGRRTATEVAAARGIQRDPAAGAAAPRAPLPLVPAARWPRRQSPCP